MASPSAVPGIGRARFGGHETGGRTRMMMMMAIVCIRLFRMLYHYLSRVAELYRRLVVANRAIPSLSCCEQVVRPYGQAGILSALVSHVCSLKTDWLKQPRNWYIYVSNQTFG